MCGFSPVRSLQYDHVNCALDMQEGSIDQSLVSLYAYGCKVNCYESHFWGWWVCSQLLHWCQGKWKSSWHQILRWSEPQLVSHGHAPHHNASAPFSMADYHDLGTGHTCFSEGKIIEKGETCGIHGDKYGINMLPRQESIHRNAITLFVDLLTEL